MAAEAVLGPSLDLLLNSVVELKGSIEAYEEILNKLQLVLKDMSPLIQNMHDLSRRADGKTAQRLKKKLDDGHKLIRKFSMELDGCCSSWCKKSGYANELQALYDSIKDYCDIIVQLQTQKTLVDVGAPWKIEEDKMDALPESNKNQDEEKVAAGGYVSRPVLRPDVHMALRSDSSDRENFV